MVYGRNFSQIQLLSGIDHDGGPHKAWKGLHIHPIGDLLSGTLFGQGPRDFHGSCTSEILTGVIMIKVGPTRVKWGWYRQLMLRLVSCLFHVQIVMGCVLWGVACTRGRTGALVRAARAACGANACLQAPQETEKRVGCATQAWLLTETRPSALSSYQPMLKSPLSLSVVRSK